MMKYVGNESLYPGQITYQAGLRRYKSSSMLKDARKPFTNLPLRLKKEQSCINYKIYFIPIFSLSQISPPIDYQWETKGKKTCHTAQEG